MMNEPNLAVLSSLITTAYFGESLKASSLGSGRFSSAFLVEFKNKKYVIKISNKQNTFDSFIKEQKITNLAYQAGFAASKIIDVGRHQNINYSVQTFLDNTISLKEYLQRGNLPHKDLWFNLGEYSANLHKINTDKQIVDSPNLYSEEWIDNLIKLNDQKIIDQEILVKIKISLKNIPKPKRLYIHHRDYGRGNILVDEKSGELKGLIDFGTAIIDYLNPIADIGLWVGSSESMKIASFLAGYTGNKLLSNEEIHIFQTYRMISILGKISLENDQSLIEKAKKDLNDIMLTSFLD